MKDRSFRRSSVVKKIRAVAGARQDRERAFGQRGLGQHLADDERAERRQRGRLHHEGTAHRQRRCHLVRGQIQGEIERRYERAGADRHPLPHAVVAACAGRNLQRLQRPVHAHGFFRRDAKGVDQPGDFTARVLDRLAGLDAQRDGQLLGAFLKARHAVIEDRLAFVGRQRGGGGRGGDRGGNRAVDVGGVCQRHAGDDVAGVFVGHGQISTAVDRLAGQIERITRFQLHARTSRLQMAALRTFNSRFRIWSFSL